MIDKTIYLAKRSTGAGFTSNNSNPTLFSTYHSAGPDGFKLALTGTSGPSAAVATATYVHNASGTPAVASASTPSVSNVSGWHFYAARNQSGAGAKAWDVTDNKANASPTTDASVSGSNTCWIGADHNGLIVGASDMSMAAVYAGAALTDNDITGVVYPFVQAYMASLGITI